MKKTKKNLEKIVSKLQWNVFKEDFNARKITIYNVFHHTGFCSSVVQSLLQCDTKEEFSEKLRCNVAYYYWAKCEWEIVITDWPTSLTKEEVDRLYTECEEPKEKYGQYPYRVHPSLDVGKKVDVYDQLKLNWDIFVDYIWDNIEERIDK